MQTVFSKKNFLTGTHMPVFHAHIPKGRFSKERKRAIAESLNRSLVEALGIPAGDRFIMISEHDDDELFIDPTFMDMDRTADAMIITVLIGAHRPSDDKQKLLAAITRLLQANADISPDDVFVALVPVPNENFSFGRGVAQLADASPRW
ncbi:tautomerase family protein [Paraburkholderia youngii]|uniref:tautomerase family protein n=1 Tax=Paraburkholderia youngii TaxID=2782701 RepID=UPI0020CE9E87|nr:tautomerase family protein [Paraburkholderia youngii]